MVLSGNAHHMPPEVPGGNAVAVGPGGAVAPAAAAEQHPLRLYWEYLSFLFRCAPGVQPQAGDADALAACADPSLVSPGALAGAA